MTYGSPVIKQCEHCEEEYKCPNLRADKSRFCSVTCSNKSRSLQRIEYKCAACNEKFMALPQQGKDRKYCSKKCFTSGHIKPADKECKNCGSVFTAFRSHEGIIDDGRRRYCSDKCRIEGLRKYQEQECDNCGSLFYPYSKKQNEQRETGKTCSLKCKKAFYRGVNSKVFKGGSYLNTTLNQNFVLVGKRDGYVGKYTAEHRVICAKQIGRLLKRNEVVIHINNQSSDNRLENLFICESMSEYARRRQGSLPWPKKSNLEEYKEKNT